MPLHAAPAADAPSVEPSADASGAAAAASPGDAASGGRLAARAKPTRPPPRQGVSPRRLGGSGVSPLRGSLAAMDADGAASGASLTADPPASDAYRRSRLFSVMDASRSNLRSGSEPQEGRPNNVVLHSVLVDTRGMTGDQVDALLSVRAKVEASHDDVQRSAELFNKKAEECSVVAQALKEKEELIERLRSGEADDVRSFKDRNSEAYQQLSGRVDALSTELVAAQGEAADLRSAASDAERDASLQRIRAEAAEGEMRGFREKTLATIDAQQRAVEEAHRRASDASAELQEEKKRASNLEGKANKMAVANDELELDVQRKDEDLRRVRAELEALKNANQGMVIELKNYELLKQEDDDAIDALEQVSVHNKQRNNNRKRQTHSHDHALPPPLHTQKNQDQEQKMKNDMDSVADQLQAQARRLFLANEELGNALDNVDPADAENAEAAADLEQQMCDADLFAEVLRTGELSATVSDLVDRQRTEIADLRLLAYVCVCCLFLAVHQHQHPRHATGKHAFSKPKRQRPAAKSRPPKQRRSTRSPPPPPPPPSTHAWPPRRTRRPPARRSRPSPTPTCWTASPAAQAPRRRRRRPRARRRRATRPRRWRRRRRRRGRRSRRRRRPSTSCSPPPTRRGAMRRAAPPTQPPLPPLRRRRRRRRRGAGGRRRWRRRRRRRARRLRRRRTRPGGCWRGLRRSWRRRRRGSGESGRRRRSVRRRRCAGRRTTWSRRRRGCGSRSRRRRRTDATRCSVRTRRRRRWRRSLRRRATMLRGGSWMRCAGRRTTWSRRRRGLATRLKARRPTAARR